jgi:hypothetical protein
MAVQISTNVEFIQANTFINPGFILLPSTTTLAGRLLTIKDTTGTFGLRPLTLSTIGNDRFEEGVNLKRLVEPFGYITLASDGVNRWYTIDGTSMNTYTISTLTNPISISTQSVFTSSATVSTLGFEDRDFNSVSSFYTRSTLLYLGSNIIGGSKCGPTLFIPIRRPFLPNQFSGLQMWFDAQDINTIQLNGSLVRGWLDKSGNNNSLTQPIVSVQPTFFLIPQNPSVYGIFFPGSGAQQLFSIRNNPLIGNATRSMFLISYMNTTTSRLIIDTGNNTTTAPPNTFGIDQFPNGNQVFAPYVYASADNIITTNAIQFNCVYCYYDSSVSQVGGGVNFTGFLTKNTTLNTANTQLRMGIRPDGTGCFNSYICEFLYYNFVPNQTQREQIEGYLAWKWNLVQKLPSNHPFKTAPP